MNRKKGASLQVWRGRVYAATQRIPKGRVATYADIARAIGHPKAWRHVGSVLGMNRDPKTPCHRVVRSDGGMGGYGFPGGIAEKIEKLKTEGIEFTRERVDLDRFRIASHRILIAAISS